NCLSMMYTIFMHSHFIFVMHLTAPTKIYTLSLHDALPISRTTSPTNQALLPIAECRLSRFTLIKQHPLRSLPRRMLLDQRKPARSEEHTSELQSHLNIVCRLLLEKKKYKI